MKTFIQIFIIILSFFFIINCQAASGIVVKVSEKIPGANCGDKPINGNYECTIKPGFNFVVDIAGNIIKWFTAITALAGVLFIVVNGILLSMGIFEKDKVKEKIIKTLSGLIILLLSGLILNIIAPWVYK